MRKASAPTPPPDVLSEAITTTRMPTRDTTISKVDCYSIPTNFQAEVQLVQLPRSFRERCSCRGNTKWPSIKLP